MFHTFFKKTYFTFFFFRLILKWKMVFQFQKMKHFILSIVKIFPLNTEKLLFFLLFHLKSCLVQLNLKYGPSPFKPVILGILK